MRRRAGRTRVIRRSTVRRDAAYWSVCGLRAATRDTRGVKVAYWSQPISNLRF